MGWVLGRVMQRPMTWDLGWTFSPYAVNTEHVVLEDYFADFLKTLYSETVRQ
jgi:hypothetical protein